jgi:acylphosphatase
VLSPDAPSDPLTRAEGFRYLSRITRAALQTFVEHNDPRAPVLQRVVHETAKMGADNPDNVYLNAAISGEHAYRIVGTRGTAHFLSMATQVGHYGRGNGMPPTGQIDTSELAVREDGTLEVIVSCERPARLEAGQTWLPMTRESGTLIVRQSRLEPKETIAELRIERVGGDRAPAPLTPAMLDEGFESTASLVNGAAMLFAAWAKMFQAHTNELPRFDQEMSNRFGGVADIAYYHSYWKLAPDEALVIEATPPACDHWNFQLNNHWMESLDYRWHRIHVNSATAALREDGSVRVVVAHRDPGVPNWIETAGHELGTMCWRWVRPVGDPPQPRTRVVKLESLLAAAANPDGLNTGAPRETP